LCHRLLGSTTVMAFVTDPDGSVWLLRGDRVCQFSNGSWQTVVAGSPGTRLNSPMCRDVTDGVWLIAAEPDSEAWELRHLTTSGAQLGRIPLPPAVGVANKPVSALLVDHLGRFWLTDWWGGVWQGDRHGGWRQLATEGALRRCVVTCLLEDRQGAIWVGTLGEGVHRIAAKVVEMVMPPETAQRTVVVGVCGDPAGGMWFGVEGDAAYQFRDGRLRRFGEAEGLAGRDVRSVMVDRSGRVWVGSGTGPFMLQGGRFEPVPVPTGTVLTFFEDRAGRLWLGGHEGKGALWCLDRAGHWSSLRPADDSVSLDIRGLAEDPDGRIWVAAFRSGLWRVEGDRLESANARLGLARTDLRSVYCDHEGGIWLGTLYGGLLHWHEGRLRHLTRDDGLADDSILGMVDDGHGGLWFSSSNGVFSCSLASLAGHVKGGPPLLCWRVGPEDGLGNRGCSGGGQPVISRMGDDTLVVADMVGVAVIRPGEGGPGGPEPVVTVESVVADGIALPMGGRDLLAPASTRRFEFQFAAPDLARARHQRFRYRLDPLDHDWLDAGDGRSVSYSRLEPGVYQFRVMVGGNDGVWRESTRPVSLRVTPQFWQARWFAPVVAVLVASLVGGVIVWRTRSKLRQRMEHLEMGHALERERARIARDIHDDLGTNLTEILMISETESVEPGDAGRRLRRIGGKTRSLIQALDEIVWAVGPANDNLPKLADYLCAVSEELCESAGVRCWHDVPAGLPWLPLSVDYRHQVFLAVKEALNNALKHAQATEIWLRIELVGGRLRLEVRDNGRGFVVGGGGKCGNGLANMRERVGAVAGSLEIRSEPESGTTVVFDLPLPTV